MKLMAGFLGAAGVGGVGMTRFGGDGNCVGMVGRGAVCVPERGFIGWGVMGNHGFGVRVGIRYLVSVLKVGRERGERRRGGEMGRLAAGVANNKSGGRGRAKAMETARKTKDFVQGEKKSEKDQEQEEEKSGNGSRGKQRDVANSGKATVERVFDNTAPTRGNSNNGGKSKEASRKGKNVVVGRIGIGKRRRSKKEEQITLRKEGRDDVRKEEENQKEERITDAGATKEESTGSNNTTSSASGRSRGDGLKRIRTSSQRNKRGRGTAITKTGRDKVPFRRYVRELNRATLLRHSEETQLAVRVREGIEVEKMRETLRKDLGRVATLLEVANAMKLGEDVVRRRLMDGLGAKNDLVSRNLGLVMKIALTMAAKTQMHGLTVDDLVQEGSLGLIRAAEKFEPHRGYRFSTYATWWVRATIYRAMSVQSRVIKVPSSVADEYWRIRRTHQELVANGAVAPSEEQIAEKLGITVAKMRFVVGVVTQRPASLDIGIYQESEGSRTMADVIAGQEDVELAMVEDMQRRELDQTLKAKLRPQERAAVRLRFGLDDGHSRTLMEIGQLMGYSKESVRKFIFAGLQKLKTPEVREALSDYLR